MKPIYLDYAATTPIDPAVRIAMEPYLVEQFGNPHAEHMHAIGPASAIEEARHKVADLIGAQSAEIVFTSGATEANNSALKGVMTSPERRGPHLIVSAIEHSCVLESARALERQGCELTILPVGTDGVVSPDKVAEAITPRTALVSVMLLNNEIGSVQPLAAISKRLRGDGIVLHTDAAQAAARIAIDVEELGVDLLSLSGHKVYAPMGVGALYISADCPVTLEPLIHGGGQQGGRRGGTLPTFLCVGIGEAARIARTTKSHQVNEGGAVRFIAGITAVVPDVAINGSWPTQANAIVNLRFAGAAAVDVLQFLYSNLSASMGSACHTGSLERSHVLAALGLNEQESAASIRFSFGRTTTDEEIDVAVNAIANAVEKARLLQT